MMLKYLKHGSTHEDSKQPDEYTKAAKKALMFFNAQRSGHLPSDNGVRWRGDSSLRDGLNSMSNTDDLVGGYYDAGDNIKFHFPMAFSMTMLSWSVIEHRHKYETIQEYKHIRSIIRWGTEYILKTFNSNATAINLICSQVGTAYSMENDHYCWARPEDVDSSRKVISVISAPDLGGEMAAALAAASIVFRDDPIYSQKLIHGASIVYAFARSSMRTTYSSFTTTTEQSYKSSGYWDEYVWAAAWMYYASGNESYMSFGTDVRLSENAKVSSKVPGSSVLSWDNKLPAAVLLWTRMRIFMDPGYPYEESLRGYHKAVEHNMCSYMKRYEVFNWTKGGLIQLNHGQLRALQYVVNAGFLANLYADYMDASNMRGWYCDRDYFSSNALRKFASSQLRYIMGANPKNMSYIVGYGSKYPQRVHHRGASIPNDGVKYSCRSGPRWRDSKKANPNTIVGAMVGGPDEHDDFLDVRVEQGYTEPTLAGNAGLVAALMSMTGAGGRSFDKDTIFGAITSFYPAAPPPPQPWTP